MRDALIALITGGALVALYDTAAAHHSFAMFDQKNPIELQGVVKEFKYSAPHVFIFLEARNADGSNATWSLEGNSPSALRRDGWTSKTLNPGDELRITIDPLRSGAPGGAFVTRGVKFKDGSPVIKKVPEGGRKD
jgi:hypothetical protein